MAILTQSNSGSGDGPITGWSIQKLAQPGLQVAVCLAIKDTLNYETPTYDTPVWVKDATRFLFGLADGSMVQTSEMKISGNEKSKLYKMLFLGSVILLQSDSTPKAWSARELR